MNDERSLVNWTHLIYGLHAFSLLTGILGAATVVGAFLTGWPSIIAVILNYVKRSDVRGTWLESHFRWQIPHILVRSALGVALHRVHPDDARHRPPHRLAAAWPRRVVVHLPNRAWMDEAQRRPTDAAMNSDGLRGRPFCLVLDMMQAGLNGVSEGGVPCHE